MKLVTELLKLFLTTVVFTLAILGISVAIVFGMDQAGLL